MRRGNPVAPPPKAGEVDCRQFTKSEILALDIATKTGYHSTHESGEWDFKETIKNNNNKQHKHFRDTLMAFIKKYDIKFIVAEELIAFNNRFGGTKKLGEFRGILLEVCDELDLPEPEFFSPATLKITAAGIGNADKKQVMDGILMKYGIDVKGQDNRADAIACYYSFIKKYHIIK